MTHTHIYTCVQGLRSSYTDLGPDAEKIPDSDLDLKGSKYTSGKGLASYKSGSRESYSSSKGSRELYSQDTQVTMVMMS